MIRGTLISPTNILLEHPLLSPLDCAEFVVISKKEYETRRAAHIGNSLMLGILVGIVATIVAGAMMFWGVL
jgi:hypothetical protein